MFLFIRGELILSWNFLVLIKMPNTKLYNEIWNVRVLDFKPVELGLIPVLLDIFIKIVRFLPIQNVIFLFQRFPELIDTASPRVLNTRNLRELSKLSIKQLGDLHMVNVLIILIFIHQTLCHSTIRFTP